MDDITPGETGAAAATMMITMPPVTAIETARLRLRCVEPRDAAALAALMTEQISARLASWPIPYTERMAEERIQGLRDAASDGRCLPFVAERRADGMVCGWISIAHAPRDPETALVTYWLGEAHQRRGLMREAAPAVVAAGFQALRVARVRAAVQADNAPSLAITRALGMRPMGKGRIWCPARGRDEPCLWFELSAPGAMAEPAAPRDRPPGPAAAAALPGRGA